METPTASHNLAGRVALHKQLAQVVRDLCILYSRVALLQLIQCQEEAPEGQVKELALRLLDCQDSEASRCQSSVNNLLHILRLSASYTCRTRGYVETLSRVPYAQSAPPNLGSVLLAGGAPLLQSIQGGLRRLFFTGRSLVETFGITIPCSIPCSPPLLPLLPL